MQVYVSARGGDLEKPYQELKGFAKTDTLKPGESQTVEIPIEIKDLASYREDQAAWILEKGDYLVRVGNSSRNTCAAAVLRAEEDILCEQCRNLCVPKETIEEISAAEAGKDQRQRRIRRFLILLCSK